MQNEDSLKYDDEDVRFAKVAAITEDDEWCLKASSSVTEPNRKKRASVQTLFFCIIPVLEQDN